MDRRFFERRVMKNRKANTTMIKTGTIENFTPTPIRPKFAGLPKTAEFVGLRPRKA
jgi:hypothetical protein